MSQFAVILPAAGESSRFKGFRRKKPFVELKGRAVWLRSVDHFVSRDDVSEVVLVLSKDDVNEFRERFLANLAFLDVRIVEGGSTRAESVRNGLAALETEPEFVAVHDAARPLLTKTWLDDLFSAAQQHNAVIPGTAISSTIKRLDADNNIKATVDRSRLYQAQTPQVFQRVLLQNAYDMAGDLSQFTDEASLVEATGHLVRVIDGWPMNIKITTADDFRMAEALLDALPKPKGLENLHPFADERFD